jgi:hypothetical protein
MEDSRSTTWACATRVDAPPEQAKTATIPTIDHLTTAHLPVSDVEVNRRSDGSSHGTAHRGRILTSDPELEKPNPPPEPAGLRDNRIAAFVTITQHSGLMERGSVVTRSGRSR